MRILAAIYPPDAIRRILDSIKIGFWRPDTITRFPSPGNLVAAAGSHWDTIIILQISASLIHGNLSMMPQFERGSTMRMPG
jgi:hypothetical protein